jgi:glycosyltransferase involved in cell wall biosynthesis
VKILIVCYSYFPELSPRAFRWTAIAEELVRLGHQVEVICASNPSRAGRECVGGVEIHRTGSNVRELVKRWLRLEATVGPASAATKIGAPVSIRSSVGQLMKSAYRHSVRKILWPDFAAFWYFSALKRAHALIQRSRPDVVVSVSLPYTGHLVGLALKRRYAIQWLVDIGDPFSFMTETPVNNPTLFRGLNARSESSVLELADAVAVTTEGTRLEYLRCFPAMEQSKIAVVPPLFAPPKSAEVVATSCAKSNKIRLVFAGTLYRSIRNPEGLLKFFRRLLSTPLGAQLELHFYGVVNDCQPCFAAYSDLMESQVFIHGLVSRAEAVRAMQEATVLVNLGNSTAYQLPSKVVEYVMLGKPVLNLTKLDSDSSQSFFSDFSGVCNVTERALEGDAAEFDRVRRFVENPPAIAATYVEQLARTHSTQAVTQNYLTLFGEGSQRPRDRI